MSDLGEISAELRLVLGRLERVLARFGDLDRNRLAAIEAELARRPDGRQAAALIGRARGLLRQAGEGTLAARRAGDAWLAQHGSSQGGGSRSAEFQAGSGAGDSEASGAYSSGFETPGGRAYFSPQEVDTRAAASALPSFPGEYTLDAHGSTEHVFVDGRALSATEVAELIKADSRWGGRPVRLFSCDTGRGGTPIAQEVARILGVKVTAPDGIAWSSADGRYGVHPVRIKVVDGMAFEVEDREVEGSWRVFDPR